MVTAKTPQLTFNRGRIGDEAQARVDVERVRVSADRMTNWWPTILGPMRTRPGLAYVGEELDTGYKVPFITSNEESAILSFTPGQMQIWDNGDTLLSSRSVSTQIVNFGLNGGVLAPWVDDSDGAGGAASVGDNLELYGEPNNEARIVQRVPVLSADRTKTHTLQVKVVRGPVLFRVGTASNTDDVFRQAVLRQGIHFISFTPGASAFWVTLASRSYFTTFVDYCLVANGGPMTLFTPWVTEEDCRNIRVQQVNDVMFVACKGRPPYRIERRPNKSWSVCRYENPNGPYQGENLTNVTLRPTSIRGAMLVDASAQTFNPKHVGSVWRLSSSGQRTDDPLSSGSTYGNLIRVVGAGRRNIGVVITGTWSGTLTLQQAIGSPDGWVDVETFTDNTDGQFNYDDGLANQEVYYRIGFNPGDYTSGTANTSLRDNEGSITGRFVITGYNSPTQVQVNAITPMGSTRPSILWSEGAWSDYATWPSAVAFADGRLWWFGDGQVWGSVSDDLNNFDPNYEGDAGPVLKQLGGGGVGSVNWAMGMDRLVVATDDRIQSLRSTSLDEPLTPSNFNIKTRSTRGSTSVAAALSNTSAFFVPQSRTSVHQLVYDPPSYDYVTTDATTIVPEIADAGVRRVAVTSEPHTVVHVVLDDGTAAVLLRDPDEEVTCWFNVETDGFIEDVVVLPGRGGDRVFYTVRRTRPPSSEGLPDIVVRCHEELVSPKLCQGEAENRSLDSHVVFGGEGAPVDTVYIKHLTRKTVSVWADGKNLGEFVAAVGTGKVELDKPYTHVCVGLPYTAGFRSAKIVLEGEGGITLNEKAKLTHLGLMLRNVTALEYGPDFDVMDRLPLVEDGAPIEAGHRARYYQEAVEFPGDYDVDPRVCFRVVSPDTCTLMAMVVRGDWKT